MGRKASITPDEVLNARAQLVAQKRPHGIIAIRTALGRGSPQLIAKYLRESGDPPGGAPSSPGGLPDRISKAAAHVWDEVWHETAALIGESEAAAEQLEARFAAERDHATAEINSLRQSVTIKESEIQAMREERRALERANATLSAELESAKSHTVQLEQQLMQQQDLFETWRQEQIHERNLLKTHLDRLAAAPSGRLPTRRKLKKGEQLDLYPEDGTNDLFTAEDPNDGG